MGKKKVSRHQEEADKTVEAVKQNLDKLDAALDEHGTPLRVDNYGGKNVWKYDNDDFKLETE